MFWRSVAGGCVHRWWSLRVAVWGVCGCLSDVVNCGVGRCMCGGS
jgi:hypothetical protein